VFTRREFGKVMIGGIAMYLTKNFTTDEFQCHCGCGDSEMDRDFMQILQNMRDELKIPLNPSSGYRCPIWNNKVSSTGMTGPHTHRRSVDIKIHGAAAIKLLAIAIKHGMTGIGLKQHGRHKERFIHLDNLGEGYHGPRPWNWTYS